VTPIIVGLLVLIGAGVVYDAYVKRAVHRRRSLRRLKDLE